MKQVLSLFPSNRAGSREVAIIKSRPLPAGNPDGVVAETPVCINSMIRQWILVLNRMYKSKLAYKSVE